MNNFYEGYRYICTQIIFSEMTILDAIIAPFYLALIFFFAFRYKRMRLKNSNIASYFLPGLAFKLFGTFCFAMIYQFYYSNGTLGGDTSAYWFFGNKIQEILLEEPVIGLKLLAYDKGDILDAELLHYKQHFRDIGGEMFQISKIVSITSIFGFKTYLNTAFLFGTFAFLGQWRILQVFAPKYPSIVKPLAIGCLFIPSMAFWGSAIMKDTLTLGALGFIFAGINNLVFSKKKNPVSIIYIVVFTLLILELKAYIILAFTPALFFWLVFGLSSRIQNLTLRVFVFIFLALVSIPSGLFVLSQLASVSQKYQLERIEEIAKGFQNYHGSLHERGAAGSGYTLPLYGFTPIGILKSLPAAVNVTLYRPYIWEARSPVMLISAMESLAFLLFSIYLIFKAGIFRFIKYFGRADVVLCMTFSIILALAIGLTAFNFGALVRFKIPIIPFFASGLLIIYHFSQEDTKAKKELLMRRRARAKMWSKPAGETPELAK